METQIDKMKMLMGAVSTTVSHTVSTRWHCLSECERTVDKRKSKTELHSKGVFTQECSIREHTVHPRVIKDTLGI